MIVIMMITMKFEKKNSCWQKLNQFNDKTFRYTGMKLIAAYYWSRSMDIITDDHDNYHNDYED